MRLHEFIRANREQILMDWETFARTCVPASTTMDVDALRDHASAMLTLIAAELETGRHAQPLPEQARRSTPNRSTVATPALAHGSGRAESGFTVEQMVAEYRALRSSVIRLWTREQGELKTGDVEDLSRFNEAIDRSLAFSVSKYNENVEKAKEMFIAILGHDLRTPLGAIDTSARFMLDAEGLNEPHRTLLTRIAASATRTRYLIGDLLDFTRSRLGGGIPVERAEMDLEAIVQEVVAEITAAYPQRRIEVSVRGEMLVPWDAARMSQALTNLIGNAVEHGSPLDPVTIELRGEEADVAISIHNRGAVIPAEQLDGIFNPMKVSPAPRKPSTGGPSGNLGLGLYIAERIVDAHGGRIEVESSETEGTTFTIHLPRGQ
jgi:signal transduction histidine kinase